MKSNYYIKFQKYIISAVSWEYSTYIINIIPKPGYDPPTWAPVRKFYMRKTIEDILSSKTEFLFSLKGSLSEPDTSIHKIDTEKKLFARSINYLLTESYNFKFEEIQEVWKKYKETLT